MSEYVNRLLTNRVEDVPKNKAVIIFGARQVGKTTLLKHIFRNEKTRWFTGDDPSDVNFLSSISSTPDLKMLLDSAKNIIIDEAQRIPSVGMLIKRVIDLESSTRLFVTGSSSLDLAGGVYESATGRVRPLTLWPLSAEEIALHSSWFDVVRSLPERMILGNYPSVVLNPKEAKENLKTYIDGVLFKDIFAYAGVRKHPSFMRLVQVLAYRIGSLSTTDSLARECGLNAGTIESYLGLLEECFIIKVLPSFARNLANELRKSKKIYFCDLGIRNAIINNFSHVSTRKTEEQGMLFENYFMIERIKLHSYSNSFVSHYFWRNKSASEIDLIEEKDNQIHAFELKLSRDHVKVPPTFAKAYPEASFDVVNEKNFYQFLSSTAL